MIDINWSAVVGTAGGICSAMSFFPQILKVRRQGGRDLSMAMLTLLLSGAILWFAYGVINQRPRSWSRTSRSSVSSRPSTIMKIVWSGGRSQERRQRIAIDMDEVMADALTEHLRRYNAAYGASVTAAELSGRHLEQCIPPAHREAAEAMLDASFFEDLAVLPDCQEVVRELADRYDVFIASAAMDVPCSFDAKYRWLQRHFPFIPPSHIVFCGDKTHRRRRLSDRRSTATLREVQGAGPAVLGAAQCRSDRLHASRILERGARTFRPARFTSRESPPPYQRGGRDRRTRVTPVGRPRGAVSDPFETRIQSACARTDELVAGARPAAFAVLT